jgi:hypothetical protein
VLTCLLEPDALPDPATLGPLVARLTASATTSKHPLTLLATGVFDYRTGRFSAAIERLQGLSDGVAATPIEEFIRAQARVVRAMAHRRLDGAEAARKQLAAAEALARQANVDRESSGTLPHYWGEWLRYRVLRREAEGLLGAVGNGRSEGNEATE